MRRLSDTVQTPPFCEEIIERYCTLGTARHAACNNGHLHAWQSQWTTPAVQYSNYKKVGRQRVVVVVFAMLLQLYHAPSLSL